MRNVSSLSFSVLVAVLFAGCAPAASSSSSTQSDEVVGGRAERGYPAVGYLQKDGDDAPFCTATLVAPDRVVTAAHCVDQMGGHATSFGVGAFGGKRIAVKAALEHPSWVPAAALDSQVWLHDVAVLTLVERSEIAPVPYADGGHDAPTCDARYVGYGRVTEGGRDVKEGYTGERKSTRACLDGHEAGMLSAKGKDGGLCWGDSGGPLFVDGKIAGVLHGHALGPAGSEPRCEVGNPVVFTSLADEKDFVACAVSGRVALAPDMHCHWAEALVAPLVAEAIVLPASDGTLRPSRAVTRADWARWVARALRPTAKHAAVELVDAPSGDLGDEVTTAIRGGYFDGTPEVLAGRLRAGATMTRRELLVGVAGSVEAAAARGLAISYPDPKDLRVDAVATRAEAAAIVSLARSRP